MASALNQVWMPWQSNRDAEGWQVALKTLEYPRIPRIPRISRSENSQVLGSPRGWSRFRMKNSARAILALLAASVPAFSYRWGGCVHMAFLITAHGKSWKLSFFPWHGCVQSWKMSNLLHGPISTNQILPQEKHVNRDIFGTSNLQNRTFEVSCDE